MEMFNNKRAQRTIEDETTKSYTLTTAFFLPDVAFVPPRPFLAAAPPFAGALFTFAAFYKKRNGRYDQFVIVTFEAPKVKPYLHRRCCHRHSPIGPLHQPSPDHSPPRLTCQRAAFYVDSMLPQRRRKEAYALTY
ncbi:hypothetical protein M513_03935 [Trichuris suis]|uniref:Uncharacterized protein n=1 Tax=Trichuris suis TaxID=68888 RepID=A0A085MDJ8_9BILA|nr:hypothetical protein M513_03935 [Trichuris suis]